MILLWSMLATASAPPAPMILATPSNAGQWIRDDDYPHEALRENRKGVVGYRIVVTPTGLPQSCSIVSGSFDDFNQATCAMVLKRSRFVPAADDQGQPIYSAYSDRFVWTIPGSGFVPPPKIPDIEVVLNKLPGDRRKELVVEVILLFDSEGKILKCRAERNKNLTVFGDLACQQAMTLPTPTPVVDGAGQPVRWLERFTVSFSASPSSH